MEPAPRRAVLVPNRLSWEDRPMSVDFNSMPRDEPGLGESATPMFATAPTYATRTVKKKSSVAPLAIAAGIVAIGGLAAAGWYAIQPHETGMAKLTPGTQVATAPVVPPPELIPSAAPAPTEPA